MNFFTTHISTSAKELVNEALDSTMISAGKMADRFEQELAKQLGIINPVTVNSGTSALHLALAIADIGPGDEVILPAQTFIATGFVILMQGAKPVFADIQLDTGNISPASIREKITDKTKAIIPVHWGGYPCDMDEINQIAQEHNLAVIEDAAHALGAVYKGKPIGTVSRFTAFSFQAIKHLTTGDGGALCCLSATDHYQARKRRWFDIDRENAKADILGERVYNATATGYKYHMNDIAAALGLGNLGHNASRQKRILELADRYRTELNNVPGLSLLNYNSDRQSAYWLFTVLTEKRTNFIESMATREIPCSVVHLRIDNNTVFGGKRKDLSGQDQFNEQQVSIPLHADLSDEDVNKVIEAIKKGW